MDTIILVGNVLALIMLSFPVFFGYCFGSTMADKVVHHFHPERYPYYYEVIDLDSLTPKELKRLQKDLQEALYRVSFDV